MRHDRCVDRLIDKLVVGIGCVAIVVAAEPDAFAIVGVLWALVASGLFEWLRAPWRTLPLDAYLVVCLVWPLFLPMLPLIAYDVLRGERRDREGPALLAAASLGLAIVVLIDAVLVLAVVPAVLVCLFAALAAMLSWRTTTMQERKLRQQRTEDELRGRGIALEARNRDLRERRDYEVDLATMAERGRIARDIHDNVGHLLTRASLQVEALRVAHEGDEDPALDSGLAAVQATVDEALASVRESVHELHEGTLDLADKLRGVVGEFEEQSGITVALTCDFDSVSAPVCLAFTACVREALANAAHHGHAKTASVRVVEYPALWQLTVEDDGDAKGGGATSNPGLGLSSMEERIIALGGNFSAGPKASGHGWRVFCSVPKARGRGDRP